MKYGIIQDGKLITSVDRRQYGDEMNKEIVVEEIETKKVYDEIQKREITIEEKVTRIVEGKPVRFAEIPKDFNQLGQAVFQADPIDRGNYIEAGVVVVDLPLEDDPTEVKEEQIIKR